MNAPRIHVLMEGRARNFLLEPTPVLVWLDVFRVSGMCTVSMVLFPLTISISAPLIRVFMEGRVRSLLLDPMCVLV